VKLRNKKEDAVDGKEQPKQEETLRDRFAMAALTGLACVDSPPFKTVAKMAYEYADAMLAERKKGEIGRGATKEGGK